MGRFRHLNTHKSMRPDGMCLPSSKGLGWCHCGATLNFIQNIMLTGESSWRLEEGRYQPYLQEGEERGSEELQGSLQFLGKWCSNRSWRPFPGISRTRLSMEMVRMDLLKGSNAGPTLQPLWQDYSLHRWQWMKGCLDFRKSFNFDSHNILIDKWIKYRLDKEKSGGSKADWAATPRGL